MCDVACVITFDRVTDNVIARYQHEKSTHLPLSFLSYIGEILNIKYVYNCMIIKCIYCKLLFPR